MSCQMIVLVSGVKLPPSYL